MENQGALNRKAAQEGEAQNGLCYMGDKQKHESKVQVRPCSQAEQLLVPGLSGCEASAQASGLFHGEW